MTLPYRTHMNRVRSWPTLAVIYIRSSVAFVIPMTFIGLHALSVETATAVSTVDSSLRMARTTLEAPMTFVLTASSGAYSQDGTCFSAAAWKTTSARRTADSTES